MSLFKLTGVCPDSPPPLRHPEHPLSSRLTRLPPASTLIMDNFCLVSSFFLNRASSAPPLSHPSPSLSLRPYSCQSSSRAPSSTPNPTFFFFLSFIQPVRRTHSFSPLVQPRLYASASAQTLHMYRLENTSRSGWQVCAGIALFFPNTRPPTYS